MDGMDEMGWAMRSAVRSAVQSLPFLLLDVDVDNVGLFSRFRSF